VAPPEVAENLFPAELPDRKILVAEGLVVGLPLASSRVTVKALVAAVVAGALKGAELMTNLAPTPGSMVSTMGEEAEPTKSADELVYVAVTMFEPSFRLLMAQAAEPDFSVTAVQMEAELALKVTVPVAVPTASETRLVKTTDAPRAAGLAELEIAVDVGTGLTTWASGLEVELASLADDPLKTAVTASVPRARLLTEQVAVPEVTVTFRQRFTVPWLKVTVPAGAVVGLDTVAVRTTGAPNADGLVELLRLVVVVAGLTASETRRDVEEAKLAEELVYAALSGCVAACSEVAWHVADPPDRLTALQIGVVPSRKVTDPVGEPSPEVTLAVSVSNTPKVPGLGLAVRVAVVGAAVMVSVWVPGTSPALEDGAMSDTVIVGDPALVSP
jgi:hypothetical protein